MPNERKQDRAEVLAKRATVAIVVALPKELVAVWKSMLDERGRALDGGEGNLGKYVVFGEVPSKDGRRTPSSSCARDGRGPRRDASNSSLGTISKGRGSTDGRDRGRGTHPTKPDHDVRLGDIVVSNSDGVKQYGLR